MAVSPVVDSEIINTIFRHGFKLDSYTALLTAEIAIPATFPPVLILDPNGATQDVLLPAEADSKGLFFLVINDGAGTEILVVKEDSDTTTIATVTFPEIGIFYCDGVAWRGGVMPVT